MKTITQNLTYILILFLFLLSSCKGTDLIFKQSYSQKKLQKQWDIVNGTWTVGNQYMEGKSNSEWAILLCKKNLPDNYTLTFSTLVDPESPLFEAILNLEKEKYLGVLLNQLSKNIALEDRSLFSAEQAAKEYTFIKTTGNIGGLPKVNNTNQHIWLDWKIQRVYNQIFVWINNEAIISFNNSPQILNANGKFGFAINGGGQIKNVRLYKTSEKEVSRPDHFDERDHIMPFFLFSE